MASVQSSVTKLEVWTSEFVQLCLVDSTFDMTIESDDITDMCSAGWRETKSQIRSVSFSANGVFDTTFTAYDKLRTQAWVATADAIEDSIVVGWGQVLVRVTDADSITYKCAAQINSLGQASTSNQEARFSLDLSFSGTPTIA